MAAQLEKAQEIAKSDPKQAEQIYCKILDSTVGEDGTAEQHLHDQEKALIKLGELYRDEKNAPALANLVHKSRSFMSSTAKSKTAKLIRTLIDFFSSIPGSEQIQIEVTQDNIDWARKEKRIFLKQSLETRLVALCVRRVR